MSRLISSALIAASCLSACSTGPKVQLSPDEKPVLAGSRVRTNTTINTDTFLCYDAALARSGKPTMNIAIGNIADYTGKATDAEGAVITKGGSLMLFSALGLMPKSVRLHDRFDTSVTDLEMTYVNARQLGDGATHDVEGKQVPWLPYYGGSIQKSDYTILGGITEVNFNVDSGGYSAQVNQIGPKKRSFTMSVAADLRLVETNSLVVVATASFQKQFTGYEVGADVFNFFDVFNNKQLFDVYAGNISQEPMQLGVRAILEEATLELLSEVTHVDYSPCAYPKLVYADVAAAASNPPAGSVGQGADEDASRAGQKVAPAETATPLPAATPAPSAPPKGTSPAATQAQPVIAPEPPEAANALAPAAATGKVQAGADTMTSADQSPAKGPSVKSALPTPAVSASSHAAPATPQTTPPATASTTGTVMVGTFQMESGARNASELLATIGLTATIKPQSTDKSRIWSVRVFTARNPAILKKIQSLGFPDAYFLK